MKRVTYIDRSLSAEGTHSLRGFASLSTHNEVKSLASRLTQYCWTHWDDPVDVCMTCLVFMFVIYLLFPAVDNYYAVGPSVE